jgi:hypothetical protein
MAGSAQNDLFIMFTSPAACDRPLQQTADDEIAKGDLKSPEVALSMRSPNHFSVVTFYQVTPNPKFRRGCPLPQHGRTDGRKEVEKSIGTSPGSPVRETVKYVF